MKLKINAYISLLVCLLVTPGCTFFSEPQQQKTSLAATVQEKTTISPSIDIAQDYYGGVLPYVPNQTRGTLKQVGTRIDISHIEWGLLEFAQTRYSPSKYLFQEGQVITRTDLQGLLKDHAALVHVLEHDYLDAVSKQRKGIVIGLSMDPRYKDQQGKTAFYKDEELLNQGKTVGEQIVTAIRKEDPKSTVLLAIYRTEPGSSLIPGHFIGTGQVDEQKNTVSAWEPFHERFYLLPGSDIKEIDPNIPIQFEHFQKKLQSFFKDYVGITGAARVVDQRLVELTLTASAEYDSRTEVIQFIQFAASALPEYFPKDTHINLYVETIDKPLAIYIRPVSGDPLVHIYRK